MSQQNKNVEFVKPSEILAFLDKQQVDESKATGLRLLRRAAETIAYQQEVIDQYMTRDQHLGAAIVNVLGEEFKKAFPTEFNHDDVLQYLAGMQEQINNLQQGLLERDQIIEGYEQPKIELDIPDIKVEFVDPFEEDKQDIGLSAFSYASEHGAQSCDSSSAIGSLPKMGDAIATRNELLKRSKEFAFTMRGFVISNSQNDPKEILLQEAQYLIDQLSEY